MESLRIAAACSTISLMIPQDLLDILLCPVCKKSLSLKVTGENMK